MGTDDFRGPLDKLLQLIEEKELEITRLNLAEVTADFILYLRKLEDKVHRRELADFVVVAARMGDILMCRVYSFIRTTYAYRAEEFSERKR